MVFRGRLSALAGVMFFFMLFLLSFLLSSHFLLTTPGWPENHEYVVWGYRIKVYANAFRNMDFFPLWSVADSGMGSPMPALYHRLFNICAAIFLLVGFSLKSSAIAAVFVFELIAASAIYSVSRRLKLRIWMAFVLSMIFPHLNYVVTDWIIRGAFAELAALCVAMWLIDWCVELLLQRRFSWRIIPLMFAVMMAHLVIFYYSVFVAASAFILCFIRYRRLRKYLITRTLLASSVFAVIAAPFILMTAYLLDKVNYKYLHIYHPLNEYVDFIRYFYDGVFVWGAKITRDVCVQMDSFILAGVVILAIPLFNVLKRRRYPCSPRLLTEIFALINFIFFLFLQHRSSALFYKFVPFADMVQFPWRNLAFVTMFLLLLFIVAISTLYRRNNRWGLMVPLVILLTVGTNCLRNVTEEWHSEHGLDTLVTNWEEFAPAFDGRNDLNKTELRRYVIPLLNRGFEDISGKGAEVVIIWVGYLETSVRVNSKEGAVIAAPFNCVGLESVFIEAGDGGKRLLRSWRTSQDSRIRFALPPGEHNVVICLPSYWNVIVRGFYNREDVHE